MPPIVLILDRIRTSKPHIESKSRGLYLKKILTKVSSHSIVVNERGRLTIPRPTALIVASDDIVVHRVGVTTQVASDEVPRLVSGEAEENVQSISIMGWGDESL